MKRKSRKEATEDLDLKREDQIIEMREKLRFLARVWRVESFVNETLGVEIVVVRHQSSSAGEPGGLPAKWADRMSLQASRTSPEDVKTGPWFAPT